MRRSALLFSCLYALVAFAWAVDFDREGCGKAKHCVSVPANCHEHSAESCEYVFSFAPAKDGEAVEMEIFGRRIDENMGYVAVGFSDDPSMGSEPVVACVVEPNGSPTIAVSYNKGKQNLPIPKVDPKDVELVQSQADDQAVYCKLRHALRPNDDSLADLASQYQLLVARGPRSPDGHLAYHVDRQPVPELLALNKPVPKEPAMDPPEVDITAPMKPSEPGQIPFPNVTRTSDAPMPAESPAEAETEAPRPVQKGSGPFSLTGDTKVFLVRLHGLLMLIGWFAMIAIGVFSARYVRDTLPKQKVAGLHLWFQLHRAINVSALAFIVLGAVLILVAKDLDWTGPKASLPSQYNWSPGSIHSLFGLIAIILGLMQPFGALLRCGPDHPRRPIFNWVHRSAGYCALLLALIAAFIAVVKFKSLWSNLDWPLVILILYVVLAVLLVIALDVFSIMRSRRRQKIAIHGLELSGRGKYQQDAYESTYNPVAADDRSVTDKLAGMLGFAVFSAASVAVVVLLALFLF